MSCIGAYKPYMWDFTLLSHLTGGSVGFYIIVISLRKALSRAVFPITEIQRCIVQQIRNSTKFISCKDLRSFTADLKPIYKAATEALALQELDLFESNIAWLYMVLT